MGNDYSSDRDDDRDLQSNSDSRPKPNSVAKRRDPQACTLCGRVTRRGTTEHHLIPRRCHRNKWFKKRYSQAEMQRTIPVCHDCHRSIHRFVPREKDLGRYHNTVESLLAHEQIGRFVAWVTHRK